ncbi:MAG: gliding motility-associated C-terminal domain-containing protein [Bacteroidota bacterium]
MNKKILYILGLSLIGSIATQAQNGVFDVKIANKKIDCNARKLQVDVQVKAHDEKSKFMMGDANYRFAYNPSIISNPHLDKQGFFSSNGEVSDTHYGTHNLNGSVARMKEGIISLNTFYGGTGEGASQVGTEFMTVSTLSFDITDLKSVLEIKWHEGEGKSFPCTGMNEVVLTKTTDGTQDYQLLNAKATGTFEGLTLNLADVCSNDSKTPNNETFFIPEGFSPDGDGVNDKFEIKNPEGIKMGIQIYDRHGTLIFKEDDYKNEWDGKPNQDDLDNSKPIGRGTYYYVVKRADGKNYTRFMTVMY